MQSELHALSLSGLFVADGDHHLAVFSLPISTTPSIGQTTRSLDCGLENLRNTRKTARDVLVTGNTVRCTGKNLSACDFVAVVDFDLGLTGKVVVFENVAFLVLNGDMRMALATRFGHGTGHLTGSFIGRNLNGITISHIDEVNPPVKLRQSSLLCGSIIRSLSPLSPIAFAHVDFGNSGGCRLPFPNKGLVFTDAGRRRACGTTTSVVSVCPSFFRLPLPVAGRFDPSTTSIRLNLT